MHARAFDRYIAGTSPVHRLDPRVKVSLTLLIVLSNLLLPDAAWLAFALTWGLVCLGSILSDLGPAYILTRSFVALPFALAAVSAVFIVPGAPVTTLAVGPWSATATDAGLARFGSIVIRSWISVQVAILLVSTTAFPDVLYAFRHLRVPSLLIAIVSLMYRYLVVLADEAARLLRAREARSARLDTARRGPPIRFQARVAGNMVGQLFLRSFERSDRVYAAMLSRGYRGVPLSLRRSTFRTLDWLTLAGIGLVLVVLQVVGRVPLV